MAHVYSHCALPTLWFKREGRTHACTCGKLWVVKWYSGGMGDSFKQWTAVEYRNGQLREV